MATIQNRLVLVDQFTGAFTSYLRLCDRAVQSSREVARAAGQMEQALRRASQAGGANPPPPPVPPVPPIPPVGGARLNNAAILQAVNAMNRLNNSIQSAIRRMNQLGGAARQSIRIVQNFNISAQAVGRMDRNLTRMVSSLHRIGQDTGRMAGNMQLSVGLQQQMLEVLQRMSSQLNDVNNGIRNMNGGLRRGTGSATGLLGSFRRIVTLMATGILFRTFIKLSDSVAQTTARLNLLTDNLSRTKALQQDIFDAAQRSRSSYQDIANSVAKIGLLAGNAFSGNDEILRFAELMNKNFVISGASAQEQAAAMYQLNQAMASGRLQGDEYRSIIENAPLLAQSIEDYMHNVKGLQGTMKEWSAEGLLTAEVIKKALFAAGDEIEQRFEAMPMTWAQVWVSMKNNAITALEPVLKKINALANSDGVERLALHLTNAVQRLAEASAWAIEKLASVAGVLQENWSILQPLVLGVAAAIGVYKLAVLGAAAAEAIKTAAMTLAVPVYALLTGATMAATAAQWGLNAALYACPLVWIVGLVIAVVAAFVAVIAAINRFAGTSLTATGVVMGALTAAGGFLGNLFTGVMNIVIGVVIAIWNRLVDLGNFIANVFTDPLAAVGYLFRSTVGFVLDILAALAGAIDQVFGTGFQQTVLGWKNQMDALIADTFGKGTEVFEGVDVKEYQFERADVGDLFQQGMEIGDTWAHDLTGGVNWNPVEQVILRGMFPSQGTDKLEGLLTSGQMKVGEVGSIKKEVSISDEDLKMLTDLSERDYVSQFNMTQLTPSIHVQVTNNGGEGMDAEQLSDALGKMLMECAAASPDGCYAI